MDIITDIASLSIGMKQDSLAQAVSISLVKKTLDSSKEDSQNLIKMMELSTNPNLGSNLDVKA
ncbi:YjfB family protein [Clostridium yunnanense]|nr:YjfB family protein [Clostridium yunnanense]